MNQKLIVLFVERGNGWEFDLTSKIPAGYEVKQILSTAYKDPNKLSRGFSEMLAITLLLEKVPRVR